jgi:predicted nucleotidyltransferase
MNDTIKALLSELKSGLVQIYAERLRGLYPFGSYARGQQHPQSDLDVLIVLDRLEPYGAEIHRTSPLVSAIFLDYALSVSRVFFPETHWAHSDSPFLDNLREEAIAA